MKSVTIGNYGQSGFKGTRTSYAPTINVKLANMNMWERIAHNKGGVGNHWKAFIKNNGMGNRGVGSQPPALLKATVGIIPIIGFVNGNKSIWTDTDIYGQSKTSNEAKVWGVIDAVSAPFGYLDIKALAKPAWYIGTKTVVQPITIGNTLNTAISTHLFVHDLVE